jgi:hypothetical protein
MFQPAHVSDRTAIEPPSHARPSFRRPGRWLSRLATDALRLGLRQPASASRPLVRRWMSPRAHTPAAKWRRSAVVDERALYVVKIAEARWNLTWKEMRL